MTALREPFHVIREKLPRTCEPGARQGSTTSHPLEVETLFTVGFVLSLCRWMIAVGNSTSIVDDVGENLQRDLNDLSEGHVRVVNRGKLVR